MLMDEIINSLHINGTLLYLTQYGSHLYGTHTENSDLDFRGVYIPTINDLILHKDKDEINEELQIKITPGKHVDEDGDVIWNPGFIEYKKVDIKIFSLQKFIQLCSKADTNALDLLFSIDIYNTKTYINDRIEQYYGDRQALRYLYDNRPLLINTDRLESPCSYAFKQATKYSLKGIRRNTILQILDKCKLLSDLHTVEDLTELLLNGNLIDGKHVRIDELDNKGKIEKYLYICGVQHQFNLTLDKFKQRLQDKLDKEYISQRTIDACDGNDWKALSHAIRVLYEIKELLETGNITFPCSEFIFHIKQGWVAREEIDNTFEKEFNNILNKIQENTLNWKYDKEFWDNFILEYTKEANEYN